MFSTSNTAELAQGLFCAIKFVDENIYIKHQYIGIYKSGDKI